jgi:hypothetical protein
VATALGIVAGTAGVFGFMVLLGDENSSILALFGGTTGPGVSSPFDSCSASRGTGADELGMMRGARDLGDSGIFCRGSSSGFVALALSLA